MERILICCGCTSVDGWLAAASVLRPLMGQWPGLEIHWMGVRDSAVLYENHPAVVRFEVLDPQRSGLLKRVVDGHLRQFMPDALMHLHDGQPLPLRAGRGIRLLEPRRGTRPASGDFIAWMRTFDSAVPGNRPPTTDREMLWVHLDERWLRQLSAGFSPLLRSRSYFVIDPGHTKAQGGWPPEYWLELLRGAVTPDQTGIFPEPVLVGQDAVEPAVVELFDVFRRAGISFTCLAGRVNPVELGWLMKRAGMTLTTRPSTGVMAAALEARAIWIGGPSSDLGRTVRCFPAPILRRRWHEGRRGAEGRALAEITPAKVLSDFTDTRGPAPTSGEVTESGAA